MILIGLHGPAGSGKSTVARFLVEQYNFVPMAFADYFKVPAVALDGLAQEQVFGPAAKNHVTRKLLQRRGTEQGRDVFGNYVWVKHLDAHLYRLQTMGVQRVVIDDVRFENEADFVHLREGLVWKLVGRGGLSGEGAKHRSEIPLPASRVDWILYNDRTPRETEGLVTSNLHAFHNLLSNAEMERYAE